MTEEQARQWLRDTFGPAAEARLARFVELLLAEARRQSLIARSTLDEVWSRHIADSAQLVMMGPSNGLWLDIGSGGGLPGLVVAVLREAPLVMVEPRRKRAEFLQTSATALGLANACILQHDVQRVATPATVISARAVAAIGTLFSWSAGIVSRETVFLLPRGETAWNDLVNVQQAWHGSFHVERSLTNPHAGIVVAQDVRPK